MNYNRTPDEWSKVSASAVADGSWTQIRNVLEMAQQDIARMAIQIKRLEMCAAKKSDGGVEAQRHAAPMASVPAGETSGSDGVAAIPSDADAATTRLYRMFKNWSERGFGPDDVTWCEVRAEIAALLNSRNWQPIETAPRDGSRILATGGGLSKEVDIVAYNTIIGCWNALNDTLDDRDDEPDGYNRPALWQPLPIGELSAPPSPTLHPQQRATQEKT